MRPSRYAPVLTLAAALVLALAVLPSALTLPAANPATTLEYAPLTPTDNTTPPGGSLSSLGLGTSAGLATASGEGGSARVPVLAGVGKNPSTKRCVGSPPRQTEDPMSPPCVAHFSGDNFGSTSAGVSRGEVRVLVFFDGSGNDQPTSRGYEAQPVSHYDDLALAAKDDEFVYSRLLRAMQRFFNERFQTYGRFVHVYVHYGRAGTTPEDKRADAAEAFANVRPFAVVNIGGANADAYSWAMASRAVMTFQGVMGGISSYGQPADFFRRFPGYSWSYVPSIEQRANLYVSYACAKVFGFPVSFSGNAGENGRPRRAGLLRGEHPIRPDSSAYGKAIRDGLVRCGASFVEAVTPGNEAQTSAAIVARFRQEGVTTVLNEAGWDLTMTRAMAGAAYYPEVVIAGDDTSERPLQSRLQDSRVWSHARAVTIFPAVESIDAEPCFQAQEQGDPNLGRFEMQNFGCDIYIGMRQLFTAIQVAGPRLAPKAIEQGFRAIPAIASTSPRVPACFYDPDDYTCVKDAQAQWWDPSGTPPGSSQPGCMRMMEHGRRYLAGRWPAGDVEAQRRADDPCNLQGAELA